MEYHEVVKSLRKQLRIKGYKIIHPKDWKLVDNTDTIISSYYGRIHECYAIEYFAKQVGIVA